MNLTAQWKPEELLSVYASKGIDSDALFTIANNYNSFDEFLEGKNMPTKLSRLFGKNQIFPQDGFDKIDKGNKQIGQSQKDNVSIISYWDKEYPLLLKEIANPPAFLFVKGQLQANDSESFSIVGTRQCSQYGKITANRFSEYFAARGVIITSGLAYGIDTQSHLGAIKAGGITYAVLGGGLDNLYPAGADKFVNKIVDSGGAVITEYPYGTKPFQPHFLQRNRIISGISRVLLVVESGIKGGSMNTAAHAFDQKREVFAVPGKIDSEKSTGTNLLIKKNIASIAISPEEVFKEMNYRSQNMDLFNEKVENLHFDETETIIMNFLSLEPKHIDELCEASGLSMSVLLVKLLSLEFSGAVSQLPGKYFIKINK